MELKRNKSAWAALATLGVTAIAASATAVVKIRQKRQERKRLAEIEKEKETTNTKLTPEQMMVYNEAVRKFITLNSRVYELRHYQKELQPLIKMLATGKPIDEDTVTGVDEVDLLCHDIRQFVTKQLPFINTCIGIISEGDEYDSFVHGPINGKFNKNLDREESGEDIADGMPIKHVLKLGYFFPESTIAPYPVKSIVIV